jgi:hypothetical protein
MASATIATQMSTPSVPDGYVMLVSADNYAFLLEERFARASSVMHTMLEGSYTSQFCFTNPGPPWVAKSGSSVRALQSRRRNLNHLEVGLSCELGSYIEISLSSLTGNFLESFTRVINLPQIQGATLEIVCQYLYHQRRSHNSTRMSQPGSGMDINADAPHIPDEMVKHVLMAAAFLDL